MNSKLAYKLLVVFGLLYGNSSALTYRNALQIPVSYIDEVHDFAKVVNTLPVLELKDVGSCLEKDDSVVCAFSKNKVGTPPVEAIVDEIARKFANKEIILTGYGKAAQCATAVAARLSTKPLRANQLKVITFCGEEPLARLDNMYLSCKLNFSHRFAFHDYHNSPLIELPVSLSSELCSCRSCLAAVAGGFAGGTVASCCAQGTGLEIPIACIGTCCGAFVAIIGALHSFPSEYLPSNGVRSVFVKAKYRTWGAMTAEDWRSLGK